MFGRVFPILLLLFLFAGILFAAIVTGEVTMIIASVLFGIFVILNILQAIKMYRIDKGKRIKKDIPWGSVTMIYVCVILFVLVTGLLVININNRIHSKSIIATISSIERNNDEDEDSAETCDGYAEYVVNGKTYNSKYETSSMVCNKKLGDEVKIYYRTDKPGTVTTTKNLIFLILGSLFSGFCSILVIKKTISDEKQK